MKKILLYSIAALALFSCTPDTEKPLEAPAIQEHAYAVGTRTAYAVNWETPVKARQWTTEVRFRKTGPWHTDGMCNRLITIGNESEKGIMLRFNNDAGKHVGDPQNGSWAILQVCSNPATGDFYLGSNLVKDGIATEGPERFASAEGGEIALYKFMSDTWYTVSCVNDGSRLYVYVDGELAATINDAAYEFKLQRLDLGMIWVYAGGTHDEEDAWPNKQSFDGEIAYARFWTKACTKAEIKANLCSVHPKTKGLEMDLCFSEGEGTMVSDKSGHGHDYDIANAWWDCYGTICPIEDAAVRAAEAWKYVDTVCPN